MKKFKETVILIAEDDDGHAELITYGLKDSGICNKIIRFANGKEVMDFFKKEGCGEKSDCNNSYLLLLDINMPLVDGIEVLKLMKSDNNLKAIPVIMLTTTDDPREVEHCYKLGCNVYITKPIDFKEFTETLRRLGLFVQVVSI